MQGVWKDRNQLKLLELHVKVKYISVQESPGSDRIRYSRKYICEEFSKASMHIITVVS